MRVIAGIAKGTRLQAVPGSGTRPISDRVKENLFNVLGDEVDGAHVLDLFAGTGSVGIEALSRGASRAVFVERHSKAISTIRANLKKTRLQTSAQIVRADVFTYLAATPKPFDLIYVAPPQYVNLWHKTLLMIENQPAWLAVLGKVIVQIFPKEFEPLGLSALTLTDQRQYGSTLLSFYELSQQRD
jgi:16S rRNA (guanine(966)-N(2))-methyltransferase RsmD